METIKLYAAEALEFGWQNEKGVYTGREVTTQNAIDYLQQGNLDRLKDSNLIWFNNRMILAPKVTRINENTLNYKGYVFRYEILYGKTVEELDHTNYLKLESTNPELSGEWYDVRNIGMCHAIRFFLHNEKKLAAIKVIDVPLIARYPNHLWSVTAIVKDKETKHLPTFILNGNIQGFDTADQAVGIARNIVNPHESNEVISITAVPWVKVPNA